MSAVSVIVPVRNGAATIGDMLTALRGQASRSSPYDIVVVDNGSTDNTADIVRDHPVTLLHEPRPGPAAARNCGLQYVRSEVIVHLDADTLPTRSWLDEMVKPFADPAVVLVGGRTLTFRPETAAERYIARVGLYETESHIARRPFPFVASLNMALRRSAVVAIGGWAEELRYAEDVDLCHRLLQRFRTPIVYRPTAVLFHRNRTTDQGLRRQAWTYGEGVAHMYARYPQELGHGAVQQWRVGVKLAWRAARPLIARVSNWFGRGTADEIEFAKYHWLWTRWFWRGFYSFRTHCVYREPS